MPVDIRGKSYRTVAERIGDFRDLCPAKDGWALASEVLRMDADGVCVLARIVDPEGRTVATGLAEEGRTGKINSTSALENCETSAWGRALAAFGLAGDEVASADELAWALEQQRAKTAGKQQRAKTDDEAEWRRQVLATGVTWEAWCAWADSARKPHTPARDTWRNALAWLEDHTGEVNKHQPQQHAAK